MVISGHVRASVRECFMVLACRVVGIHASGGLDQYDNYDVGQANVGEERWSVGRPHGYV